MPEWNTTTFGDLITAGVLEIGDGYRAKLEELGGSGPIFLRAGLLTERRIEWVGADRFREELTQQVSSKLGRPGDTVITTKGNSVGRAGYVPENAPAFVYSPHLSYWRSLDSHRLAAGFLRYWSRSPAFVEQLRAMAGSTDMAPYLSLIDQRRLRISIPNIGIQEAVAEVLGTLDEKITVNDRIINASIDIAGTIFDAFVRNLETGPETFGSVAEVHGGGTPKTSEPGYWNGNIAWTTPSDATALSSPYLFETTRMITESGLANCASQLYPPGSIFMTSRATIGAFAIPQMPAAVNQGFIVVVPPREELRWWLFHEMRSQVDEMLSLANGSTFMELSRTNFKRMPVHIPSREMTALFHAKVNPLHKRAAKAAEESTTLRRLRDTLLPGLMSGEIRVRMAEETVEEVT